MYRSRKQGVISTFLNAKIIISSVVYQLSYLVTERSPASHPYSNFPLCQHEKKKGVLNADL